MYLDFFGGLCMIYVGIDVAKTTHYAAVMNSDGVVLIEPFAVEVIVSLSTANLPVYLIDLDL